jgi:hypothetical protein
MKRLILTSAAIFALIVAGPSSTSATDVTLTMPGVRLEAVGFFESSGLLRIAFKSVKGSPEPVTAGLLLLGLAGLAWAGRAPTDITTQ